MERVWIAWLEHISTTKLYEALLFMDTVSSNRIRHTLYQVENVIIPDKNELDSASFHVCETFKSQHLQDLETELPSTKW